MLCGGAPRGCHRLRRRNNAAVGWFVSFSLPIPYHMMYDLSTQIFDFSKILFFAPLPCLVPRVRFAPRSPCRLIRCPVPAPSDRAAPVSALCRLLTVHGIGGRVYTMARPTAERPSAVITSQPLVLFPPSIQLHQHYRTFRLTTDTYRTAYHATPLITQNSPQSRINTALFASFTPTATLYTHYPIETPVCAK